MAIVAAEACTTIVTRAPTMTKRMMVRKPPSATEASIDATMEPKSRSVADCCRKLSPMKRKEKPKMNSPTDLRLFLLLNINGMPKARRGRARAAMLTLKPMAEMIHAVTVVPTLAPMMTPMACERFMRPALTKDTTMTVVADEDWMSAVTMIPVSTPMKRFFVMAARMLRRRSPANFSSPSLIVFIPKRKRPREPKRERRFIISS